MKRCLAILLISILGYLDASISNASQIILSDISKPQLNLKDLEYTLMGVNYLKDNFNVSTVNVPNNCPLDLSGFKRISSYYGTRKHPILNRYIKHHGVDFAGIRKTKVYATANGVVEEIKWSPGYGKHVIIDHGNNIKTIYAHLHRWNAIKGQKVDQGDCIGLLGNTGMSTGPHLHYEIRVKGKSIDPLLLFDKDKITESELINLYVIKNKINERRNEYNSSSREFNVIDSI